MSTWLYIAIGAAILWVLARLVGSPDRNVERSRLQHYIRSLILYTQDQTVLEIHHRESRAIIRVRRCGEGPRGVELRFEVPRAGWSEGKIAEIIAAAATLEAEPIELADQPAVLLAFTAYTPARNDEWVGASAARLAQAIFAALGAAENGRYRVRMDGRASLRASRPRAERWTNSSSPVTRWIGRRIITAHDKEVGGTGDRKDTQDDSGR